MQRLLLKRLSSGPIQRRLVTSSCLQNPLFSYSTGRWLYNEKDQLAVRHVPFNVDALKEAACSALGKSSCTSFEKIAEGSYNKVFRMYFEDGKTAIARIPSLRLLGNASMITASEVATMEFMRLYRSFHIPLVYSWSKDLDGPVKSPYIIMEDIEGVPLLHDWYKIRGDPVRHAMRRFVTDVRQMLCIPFDQIGGLYFKEDLPPHLQERPLFSPALYQTETALKMFEPAIDRFRVGPIPDYTWWRTMHDEVGADRGPWKDIGDMLIAAVNLEKSAIAKYRRNPSILKKTETTSLEELDVLEGLLEKVVTLAPSLALALSNIPDFINFNVAVHADLGPNNAMVPADNGTNTLSRFDQFTYIDWQGTSILPFPFHCHIPELVQYNGDIIKVPDEYINQIPIPEGLDQLPEDQREYIMAHHRLATRELAFKNAMLDNFHPWAAANAHCLFPYITQLPDRVLRGVTHGPILLRECLMRISSEWDEEQCDGPCPISFTEDEIAAHDRAAVFRHLYFVNTKTAQKRIDMDGDGWVPNEEYEEARARFEKYRESWDPKVCGGPWPFQDGGYSYFLA
ncbi:protein kinase subdomain-containing protein PKL/CAK/Fmp29 [Coprinopsis cinerea okayama7|uniref:Altered inheritance of mitochondria protein 9, mitochondrial n=1 Tax=Coprinopsis cinerea (strain Okayama-7 / 130 / ATCC MYA-4618 / FGSC 9003) TaxID=240176 RepID=D6RN88_COPC7|nr:protein kinase subdomain-containing protein PKL/CAK/Fmp29 [Coprinopsis cinerea okayama7\|eukprot:XP_002910966.1 protein kinase subdomain-containing protein PKL/CAK/Fmp29 [Coprinopsis cinerea okayama7\